MTFLLNKKNICFKISMLCVLLITMVIALIAKLTSNQVSPLVLICYMLGVLLVSIWINFGFLQMVLNENSPIDISGNTIPSKIVKFLLGFLTVNNYHLDLIRVPLPVESIDKRIEIFVTDIERMFIRKWYTLYISKDETFLKETRNLLDVIVRRFLQITPQINSDKIIHGSLIVLLKHVKEYRKAVKKAKNFGGSVETQYRYSHVGAKSHKALEHFTLQLTTKLSRHFINWELYNSLACKCVISILSKKMVTFLLLYMSAPGFLNHKIVSKLAMDEQKKRIDFQRYSFISVSDIDLAEIKKEIVIIEEKHGIVEEGCTPKKEALKTSIDSVDGVLPKIAEDEDLRSELEVNVPVLESTTPITAAMREVSEPVKIYESRSSNKTWRNSRDLDCISLGHDILYLSDMGDSEKKPWKDSLEAEEAKPLPVLKENVQEEIVECHGVFTEQHRGHTGMSNIQSFLRPATTGAATLITNTIKPLGNATANTMKELQQSTVNNVVKPVSQVTSNAMHKIGDLQDEAAGMVEGILDFGMAGLRKGLQLTGLQDNIHESVPIRPRTESEKRDIPMKMNGKQRLAKMNHVNSDEVKVEDTAKKEEILDDNVWVNPLLQTGNISPSFEGDILLEKSPMDSKSLSRESTKSSEKIPTLEVESPEIEYEDTPDLATTTAKLRSLLAQRISESNINTPATSPMSIIPSPLDPSGGSIEDFSEVDGALPSMYKAFAKTATGVFQNTLNTLKTALPGNTGENEGQNAHNAPRLNGFDLDDRPWMFVQSDPQPTDLSAHMEKFLNERRVFCTVDNAYEAIEAVELGDQLDSSLIMTQRQFDDELDDFDTTIPMTKALIDLICELVEETYPPLVKENIVKIILLTSGRLIEEWLHDLGEKFVKSISTFIGGLPKFDDDPITMPLKIEPMVDLCLDSVPSILMSIMNKDSIKAILRLLLESLQSQKINQDTNLQLMELFTFEIISAAGQSSPTYSA